MVNETPEGSQRPTSGRGIQQNILRVKHDADVYDRYEVTEVVGSGSMGHVAKVRVKANKIGGSAFETKSEGIWSWFNCCANASAVEAPRFESQSDHIYALKSIHMDRISPVFLEELKNEVKILRSMDHPNIVKAHEVFMTKSQIYLILECCEGDLYTRAPYSERDCAHIISQVCSAVNYMHEHNIVHRDLKFENVMFETGADTTIKVIDFGLSKKFLGEPGYMTERVGTIYTMSPQVLQGVYSSQADLWSTGVMAYMALSTSKPFYSKNRRKMIDMIMRANVSYKKPGFQHVSKDAIDFCQKLIVVDPKKRMTAAQCIQHPWILNREQLPDELPDESVLAMIDDCLIHYKQTSQLKKLALNVIAHRSTTAEIVSLRKVFDSFDKEKDGILSFTEFKAALEKMEFSEDDLAEMFKSVDVNQNGHIMYTEFLAATIEARGRIEEDRIAEAFDRIDSDDTGFISRENLIEALGKHHTEEEVDKIMETADVDKDGKISYEEFLHSFRSQTLSTQGDIVDSMSTAMNTSTTSTGEDYLGVDAKIPGGRYDSGLSASLKAQIQN